MDPARPVAQAGYASSILVTGSAFPQVRALARQISKTPKCPTDHNGHNESDPHVSSLTIDVSGL
jgi:hypothetical protein